MKWRVEWSDRAEKDLSRLDRSTRQRILSAVERLAETGQGDVRQLQGSFKNTYRLRVGDRRILFSRDGARVLILVLRVRARGGAYQP